VFGKDKCTLKESQAAFQRAKSKLWLSVSSANRDWKVYFPLMREMERGMRGDSEQGKYLLAQ